MDFVGRVESLGADLVSVCEKCGLDNQNKQLLRRNVSDGISGATEFKSQELIDIVHARYAIDFDTFGYSRDPGDARASIIDEGR
jgi:hypothetical protein